jgi:hypothetical protein
MKTEEKPISKARKAFELAVILPLSIAFGVFLALTWLNVQGKGLLSASLAAILLIVIILVRQILKRTR